MNDKDRIEYENLREIKKIKHHEVFYNSVMGFFREHHEKQNGCKESPMCSEGIYTRYNLYDCDEAATILGILEEYYNSKLKPESKCSVIPQKSK